MLEKPERMMTEVGSNYTITLVDLPDVDRELHPQLPSFQRHIDHTNSHKTSLKKFQTTEIIQSLSPDSNGMKLGISN